MIQFSPPHISSIPFRLPDSAANPLDTLTLPNSRQVSFQKPGEKADAKTDANAEVVKRFEEAAKDYQKATGKALSQDLKDYDVKDKTGHLVPDERVAKIKDALKKSWGVSAPFEMKLSVDKTGSALVDGKINGEIDLGTKTNSLVKFQFDPKTGEFSIVGGGLLFQEKFTASNPASLIAGAKISANLFSPDDTLSDWANLKADKKKDFLQTLDAKMGLTKGTLQELNEIVSTKEKVAFVATDGAGQKATFVRTRDPKTGQQETSFTLEQEKSK